ncbi:MAG: hypothetical protein HY303_01370 [Candidatus Wallbacteria bacterium]|nr:hypothetical protein [Candidatus Wallbacteria bacterium]
MKGMTLAISRLLPVLLLVTGACAQAAPVSSEPASKTTAPAKAATPAPAPVPAPPRLIVDGQYRLRLQRNERTPPVGSESIDSFINHRLRLGLIAPIFDDLTLISGFSTQASRWGDFDTAKGRFTTRDFDFERLLLAWKYASDASLYAGRGAARFFEADLAIASGRLDEDNVYYEGFVWEKHPDKKTTLLAVYSPLFSTNLIDPNPVELSMQSLAFQWRRELTDRDRVLVHTGRLQPRRALPGGGGDKGLTGLMTRYDHKFSDGFKAFGSVGFNLSQTDGVFFRPLPDVPLEDRTAFFGGLIFGDREKLREHEFELYYTWTAPQAQTFVAEFPSDIREVRALWQRQVRPKVWTLASIAHREQVHTNPVLPDETTTAYVQLLAQF